MLSKEEILNRMGNKGMFEVYLHGDWSKVDSKIGINIKNAWSRESKSHGECELIVLSKTVYVEWDHLIHRKRSPFPSIGEGLKAVLFKARLPLSDALVNVIWSPVSGLLLNRPLLLTIDY